MQPSFVYSTKPYIAQYDNWLTDADINTIFSKDFEFVTGRVRRQDGSLQVDPIRQCQTHRIEYGNDPYFVPYSRDKETYIKVIAALPSNMDQGMIPDIRNYFEREFMLCSQE